VSAEDAAVGWVGQCLDDAADGTHGAITTLAAGRIDDAAIAHLNGPFAAVVLRPAPLELRVFTDRYRHYPIYLHRGRGATVASTDWRCILPWLSQTEIDLDSVDMLLRCGELIDRMTLLKGVEMLEPGSVVIDSGAGLTERRYWSMHHDGSGRQTIAANADALSAALLRAVRKLEGVTARPGITLSGGLDSRIILDLFKHPERVPSFTWGLPGCRDIACASEFARIVGSPHVVRHWRPAEFPPLWSRGVDLTGGNCGIEGMFMLPFVSLLAGSCDVVFNGLAGDALLGGNFLKHSWMGETDISRLGYSVWRWRVSEQEDLLVDRLVGQAPGEASARDRWVASIEKRGGERPVERVNDWLYENRVFRNTNCGTMLLRGGVESHAPFFDRDFLDTMLRVDLEQKTKHRLYLEVMKRVAPRSASVTWQRTNVKPARGYYVNLAAMAFHSLATRLSRPMGLTPFKHLSVAEPARWFRGAWRRPAEDLILGRSADRKLVDPRVVRQLWDEHQAGRDHTRQVGVLVALEHFARLTLDGASE
jgi:asparagine synthase (glutamine-hydrolysing)